MSSRRVKWGAAFLCSLLGGCGSLVDMGGNSSANPRRMFVNDVAVNDSLRSAILGRGVSFIMQPGKDYVLRIQTPDSESRLSLYVESGSVFSRVEDGIEGVAAGGVLEFPLSSSRTTYARHLVFLRTSFGTPAQRPARVRLFPAGEPPALSDSLRVKLIIAGGIESLPTASSRNAFVQAFHAELRDIFDVYGIVIDTVSQILAEGPPIAYDFFSNAALPGMRESNTVHMYLVNSIFVENGDVNQEILGFAPREAFDLDAHPTSRILLSAQGGGPVDVATTAAHELGHFLGLRHTTSTELDLQQDRDFSNRFDGFTSTAECQLLAKPMATPHVDAIGPEGTMYCLRVATTCPSENVCAAVTNLMFPYACGAPQNQRVLTGQQQTFLRENLWLYQ